LVLLLPPARRIISPRSGSAPHSLLFFPFFVRSGSSRASFAFFRGRSLYFFPIPQSASHPPLTPLAQTFFSPSFPSLRYFRSFFFFRYLHGPIFNSIDTVVPFLFRVFLSQSAPCSDLSSRAFFCLFLDLPLLRVLISRRPRNAIFQALSENFSLKFSAKQFFSLFLWPLFLQPAPNSDQSLRSQRPAFHYVIFLDQRPVRGPPSLRHSSVIPPP